MSESRYIVAQRKDGEPVKFLRHEGHKQYWTRHRAEAMEYTRIDVAQGLAELMGGKVEAA